MRHAAIRTGPGLDGNVRAAVRAAPRGCGATPDLPAAVDPVLATALAKNPAGRYPTCGQFAEELRTALGLYPGGADYPHGRALKGPRQVGRATPAALQPGATHRAARIGA